MRAGPLRDQGPRLRPRKTTDPNTTDRGNAPGAPFPCAACSASPIAAALCDNGHTYPLGHRTGRLRQGRGHADRESRAGWSRSRSRPTTSTQTCIAFSPNRSRASASSGMSKLQTAKSTPSCAYLERHRKDMRKIDPALAAFMCVSAIEAIAHNTVLNGAEMRWRRW